MEKSENKSKDRIANIIIIIFILVIIISKIFLNYINNNYYENKYDYAGEKIIKSIVNIDSDSYDYDEYVIITNYESYIEFGDENNFSEYKENYYNYYDSSFFESSSLLILNKPTTYCLHSINENQNSVNVDGWVSDRFEYSGCYIPSEFILIPISKNIINVNLTTNIKEQINADYNFYSNVKEILHFVMFLSVISILIIIIFINTESKKNRIIGIIILILISIIIFCIGSFLELANEKIIY